MAYGPYYYITDWQNEPSQKTSINRTNLLHMENGIKEADNRIVQLDAKKADQATVNTMVKSISMDQKTGIMTVTLVNGTVTTYDLDIEKVVVNFDITDDNQLVLTLADGTKKIIDLTRFVYSVDSTATISMQIQGRTITARIVDGSVTMEKLDAAIQTEFRQNMLDAQAARDAALDYQLYAKRYTLGDERFPGSETDNAKFYYERTKADADTSSQNATVAADSAETAIEQATIARQKATNASASETNAAASAQIATQKATAAASSEQIAKDKADIVTQKAAETAVNANQAQIQSDRAKAEADRAESYAGQANPGALTGTEATDTQGLLGAPGATVWAQTLIDKMIDNNISDDEIDDLDELVYIPKFKNSDVLIGGDNNTHPAFIVNGKEIPGFYYSKYQNVVKTVDGVNMAYSLYGKDPAVNINFDNARARCEAKGKGYHLSTMAEWAAIALWCKKNGTMPYGNNNYGKDTRETDYVAIPTSKDTTDPNKTGRVATGTGPLTWSHDETDSGVWDLNGNTWEWQGGYRTVYGEVQILANNDAANPGNPQNATSQLWKAINATTGELVAPGSAGTVKLDYVSSKWTYSASITDLKNEGRGCTFANVTFTADVKQPAQDLLRALAMLPVAGDTGYNDDYFWANNGAAERLAFRGGSWSSGTSAGVFPVSGNSSRSGVGTDIGFRSAYIPEI